MKTNNDSKKLVKIIFGIFIIFMIYRFVEHKYFINSDDTEETIAKTIEYSGSGGTRRFIRYRYFVDNKKYERAIRRDYDLKDPLNKYYIVKYSKDKPKVSELDLSQEVTDTLKIREAGFTNFGK